MKNSLWILLMAVVLNGCAVMNPPKPLPAPLAPTAPQTTLKTAGLTKPQTVWVPALYTGGSDNLLFINGKQYRSPNGAGNVMGFVKTPAGYTVAVENVPVPTTVSNNFGFPMARLQQAAQLELFAVTSNGQTTREIAHLDLKPTDQVFQTKNAFYVQRLSGWVYEPAPRTGRLPLFSYFGLNADGHRVEGPSNVRFATPAPGGGWYKWIVTGVSAWSGYHTKEVLDRDGMLQVVHSGGSLFDEPRFYVHTPAAFVNEEPVVDSERTGYVTEVSYTLNVLSSRGRGFVSFNTYNLADPTMLNSGALSPYSQTTSAMSVSEALSFVPRDAVYGQPGAAYQVRQFDGSKTVWGGVSVGIFDLQTSSKVPVFPLMGGTANTVRRFLGTNVGSISLANANADVYTVITPTGTILIDVNQNQLGAAYDTALKAQIPAIYAQEFASQYGLMP